MAPKLTSCDMFRMLLKYWLSTEGRFISGETVNPVGVLVSGGLPWCLMSGIVAGGDMTCSVMFAAVMFADCVAVWAAAAVLVLSVVGAAAVLAAVTVWNAVVELPAVAASATSVGVAACFVVEHVALAVCFAVECVHESAAEPVHAAV